MNRMSKAKDKDNAIGSIVLGALLAYGGFATLQGSSYQSLFVIGGIVIFAYGAYSFAKASGLIQTGNVKASVAKSSNALDTLNNRYAKGEITKSQYDQMRKDLSE